jgi:hypothetical protein
MEKYALIALLLPSLILAHSVLLSPQSRVDESGLKTVNEFLVKTMFTEQNNLLYERHQFSFLRKIGDQILIFVLVPLWRI